jgi:hypothetical protein
VALALAAVDQIARQAGFERFCSKCNAPVCCSAIFQMLGLRDVKQCCKLAHAIHPEPTDRSRSDAKRQAKISPPHPPSPPGLVRGGFVSPTEHVFPSSESLFLLSTVQLRGQDQDRAE